jgi:hypothetical protein
MFLTARTFRGHVFISSTTTEEAWYPLALSARNHAIKRNALRDQSFHPMPRGIEWGSKGIESPLRGAGKIWDPEEIGPVIHELIPALIAGTAGYLHPF